MALSKVTPKAGINQISGEEVGGDAVGKTGGKGGGCWNCGGMGHIAAQCTTPKGKGKGTWKGEAKGWGGKASGKGKTGVSPVKKREEADGNEEQDVNVFVKGKGKGGKDWYRYQGAWNGRPNGAG